MPTIGMRIPARAPGATLQTHDDRHIALLAVGLATGRVNRTHPQHTTIPTLVSL